VILALLYSKAVVTTSLEAVLERLTKSYVVMPEVYVVGNGCGIDDRLNGER
jgi:hypothetical protein